MRAIARTQKPKIFVAHLSAFASPIARLLQHHTVLQLAGQTPRTIVLKINCMDFLIELFVKAQAALRSYQFSTAIEWQLTRLWTVKFTHVLILSPFLEENFKRFKKPIFLFVILAAELVRSVHYNGYATGLILYCPIGVMHVLCYHLPFKIAWLVHFTWNLSISWLENWSFGVDWELTRALLQASSAKNNRGGMYP